MDVHKRCCAGLERHAGDVQVSWHRLGRGLGWGGMNIVKHKILYFEYENCFARAKGPHIHLRKKIITFCLIG